MASRTAFPGTATTSSVHQAADDNSLPGGWIGYAEVTADQTGVSTIADLTGLSQAVTVNTNRRIKITLYVSRIASTAAGDRARLYIFEGSTQLQSAAVVATYANLGESTGPLVVVLTPSSGSHTYKGRLERASGTGTLTAAASSNDPAFIAIEDIGPSS